jgi:small ligand-binding sensory domain FIST
MERFLLGHSGHPDWRSALDDAIDQLQQQTWDDATQPTLGWVYFTDDHAPHAAALLQALQAQWPGVAWTGASGVGVCATGVEYFGSSGLVLMLATLPTDQFRVFSGARPLHGFAAHTALVHADPATPALQELIGELSARTGSGYLFGGLASAREGAPLLVADAVLEGGLAGVAFGPGVALLSRLSQGSQPVGPAHEVTAVDDNVVLTLDGEPALDVLKADTGIDLAQPRQAFARLRETLVGLADPDQAALADSRAFGSDTRVRHIIGLDLGRDAFAIADEPSEGMRLAFCRRHVEAARRDLVRICSEIREELDTCSVTGAEGAAAADAAAAPPIAGAVYVSCAGRGGPHFGAPSAELQIVRHALGDVPLAGFFAAGEIARQHLFGYTGVLTVFTASQN